MLWTCRRCRVVHTQRTVSSSSSLWKSCHICVNVSTLQYSLVIATGRERLPAVRGRQQYRGWYIYLYTYIYIIVCTDTRLHLYSITGEKRALSGVIHLRGYRPLFTFSPQGFGISHRFPLADRRRWALMCLYIYICRMIVCENGECHLRIVARAYTFQTRLRYCHCQLF